MAQTRCTSGIRTTKDLSTICHRCTGLPQSLLVLTHPADPGTDPDTDSDTSNSERSDTWPQGPAPPGEEPHGPDATHEPDPDPVPDPDPDPPTNALTMWPPLAPDTSNEVAYLDTSLCNTKAADHKMTGQH